jgi:hypothetical protein
MIRSSSMNDRAMPVAHLGCDWRQFIGVKREQNPLGYLTPATGSCIGGNV